MAGLCDLSSWRVPLVQLNTRSGRLALGACSSVLYPSASFSWSVQELRIFATSSPLWRSVKTDPRIPLLGGMAEMTEIPCFYSSLRGFVSLGDQARSHVLVSALVFALQIWGFAPRSPSCIYSLQGGVLSRVVFFCSPASRGTLRNGSSPIFVTGGCTGSWIGPVELKGHFGSVLQNHHL